MSVKVNVFSHFLDKGLWPFIFMKGPMTWYFKAPPPFYDKPYNFCLELCHTYGVCVFVYNTTAHNYEETKTMHFTIMDFVATDVFDCIRNVLPVLLGEVRKSPYKLSYEIL